MEEELPTNSDSSFTKYWSEWFCSLKGNEFFCDIDEEYIVDRFNLTGLNTEVQDYNVAFDVITDAVDLNEEEWDQSFRNEVQQSARHLYGLVHARFVLTSRGLAKMAEKFRRGDFGRCPRVFCHNQNVLPVGMTDVPCTQNLKLYCPNCEDVYTPVSRRHSMIDGAYFGTTLPHLLLQVYPSLLPANKPGPPSVEQQATSPTSVTSAGTAVTAATGGGGGGGGSTVAGVSTKSSLPNNANTTGGDPTQRNPTSGKSHATSNTAAATTTTANSNGSGASPLVVIERYVPKIFGFKVHTIATEQRRQDTLREAMEQRLQSRQAQSHASHAMMSTGS